MIHFDISKLQKELEGLESQTVTQDFWNDSKNSAVVLKQINTIKRKKK